jgi:C1A family cysteine protease
MFLPSGPYRRCLWSDIAITITVVFVFITMSLSSPIPMTKTPFSFIVGPLTRSPWSSSLLRMTAEKEFIDFKDKFNKNYASLRREEDSYRVFRENHEKITQRNKRTTSYKLGVNQFTDQSMHLLYHSMLRNDFSFKSLNLPSVNDQKKKEKVMMDRVTPSPHMLRALSLSSSVSSVLEKQEHEEKNCTKRLDWYAAGFVRPVKNQGTCGSCWAFSTVGALESMIHVHTDTATELSEQELVSCSRTNHGCKGGWMHKAMDYVRKRNGLYQSIEYPYNGTDTTTGGKCRTIIPGKKRIEEAGRFDYVFVRPNSVSSLKKALFVNPVCVAVNADFDFVFYADGVYDKPLEDDPAINHAVLLTALDENTKTWTIKNSWGTGWGRQGFMDLAVRNGTGVAGINSYCVLPIYGDHLI